MRLTVTSVRKDLLEIYLLLYPMLDDWEKQTSEAQKASAIADKYDARLPVIRGERQKARGKKKP